MKTIEGDLLDIPKGILCHQVNCMGKMGAGLALQIKNKWPIVYKTYITNHKKGNLQLGKVFLIKVAEDLFIANLCGQYHYGKGKQYTEYDALNNCFKELASWKGLYKHLNIYIPIGIGCGLAGGDWNVVRKLIEESKLDATLVKRRIIK